MSEFDSAFKIIGILVKDFQRNEAHYKSLAYTEAQVRKDFIDKLWIALGWDVNHDHQTNPYEQEPARPGFPNPGHIEGRGFTAPYLELQRELYSRGDVKRTY